ncbi:hypothetical protein [Clostridium sp. Marseille-P299]|uniref:hypothetical protein n=1 Tax=Clostridium sp. Marseille-P299 TaxID=1805477 RepID=UPI000829F83C|nr:hypothetical protein [Clostridium sp. Marseille-P299]
MKRFYSIIISCVIIIALYGCNNKNDSKSFDLHDKVSDVYKITQAPNTSQAPNITQEADKEFQFSKEEIENAEAVAKEYYENTSFKVQSIHYDLTVSLYNEYVDEYDKQNLITFLVEIIDSDNPPRNIVLARKDLESVWEVIDEGY